MLIARLRCLMAGRVAEDLARTGLAAPLAQLVEFPEDLSAVDRNYAGDFTSADVAATADLVWSRWGEIAADTKNQMLWLQRIWRDQSK